MPPTPVKRPRVLRPLPQPSAEHVYREIHGVKVPLRIWPSLAPGRRPWVFWTHGGGIILPPAWVLPALREEYHVVSVGYRLLPHVSFADAVSDLEAAFAWLRAHLPSALAALSARALVDLDAYVTAGESAGGILALLLPFVLTPAPRAVFEAYAITDLSAYHPPTPAFFPPSGRFSEAEMRAALAERDPRDARVASAFLHELPPPYGRTPPGALAAATGAARGLSAAQARDAALRHDMSNLCLREKWTLPLLFRHTAADKPVLAAGSGDDVARARAEADAQYRRDVRALSPLHRLRRAPRYPPTAVWHGTRDGGVPHATHAEPLLARLADMGVDTLALFAEGGTHVFDAYIQEPADRAWDDFVTPKLAFLRRHVQPGPPEAPEAPGAGAGEEAASARPGRRERPEEAKL